MPNLVDGAFAVVTDSGGLQEETTARGVPCFTLRRNTERPITISVGTNQLSLDPRRLPELILSATRKRNLQPPEGWDGRAASMILEALSLRS
jgi:UDP-N-acetylglucosamine 2-epimerase (non-hydrolysing)